MRTESSPTWTTMTKSERNISCQPSLARSSSDASDNAMRPMLTMPSSSVSNPCELSAHSADANATTQMKTRTRLSAICTMRRPMAWHSAPSCALMVATWHSCTHSSTTAVAIQTDIHDTPPSARRSALTHRRRCSSGSAHSSMKPATATSTSARYRIEFHTLVSMRGTCTAGFHHAPPPTLRVRPVEICSHITDVISTHSAAA
mmetsp:Transcript_25077/g.50926  ORF Transcript_25077/g.50926 Transcript_25077/m.50926 type:complete len:203 (+) Transcript_25077:98-706(+)